MFNKILIANRGEIAVRVARSARRLGVASVAVYSTADRHALHVESCDQAFCIGGASPGESYLNAARILQVARDCGAEARDTFSVFRPSRPPSTRRHGRRPAPR